MVNLKLTDFTNHLIDSLNKMAITFVEKIPNIIFAIIFLILTSFVAKLLSYLFVKSLRRTWIRPNLIRILDKLFYIAIWVMSILIVCAILFPSVTPGNLITGLGVASVAVGLAFKDIFANFLAGILILWREPFREEDFIETKGEQGYVERISVRNTHLRRTDSVRIVIPNALLFNNTVLVLTDEDVRRESVKCSIDFSADLEKAREVIKSAIEKCKTVNKEKYIQVYAVSFSSNGVDFEIYWWTGSKPADIRASKDEVLSSIKKALDEEKISMTYSTPLSFLDPLSVHKAEDSKSE